MNDFFNVILVIISTIITIRSTRLIYRYQSKSLSDYTLVLLFIFQTVPVIADMFIGIPNYSAWFQGFSMSMTNPTVCTIYDLYVISINIALLIVSMYSQRNEQADFIGNISTLANNIPSALLVLLALSPAIHVLLTGNLSNILIYNSTEIRGLDPNFIELNSQLIIIGIAALMIWYFKKESSILRVTTLLVISFIIIWISGKRYSVVTVLFSFLYMYILERRNDEKRINIRLMITVCLVGVLLYSINYVTNVKVISDGTFDSTYASMRIDFGRDDVVKFTIWKEFILNQHILDYPLQSIISTIFMFVPRSLFPAKGYPHYRYLTAALFDTDPLNIPSGMTPSILEMMIANFYYIGIPLCIILLCWFCMKADKARTSFQKYCYAMVMMGMLSQSLDSMMLLFYLTIYFIFFGNLELTLKKSE